MTAVKVTEKTQEEMNKGILVQICSMDVICDKSKYAMKSR